MCHEATFREILLPSRWWKRYLQERILIKHTYSWRVEIMLISHMFFARAHCLNASENRRRKTHEHETIQTSPLRHTKIIPKRKNQWTQVKEKTRSPVRKRAKSPVRKKTPTVGDTSRKRAKKWCQDHDHHKKFRRRILISIHLKLEDMILNLKMS